MATRALKATHYNYTKLFMQTQQGLRHPYLKKEILDIYLRDLRCTSVTFLGYHNWLQSDAAFVYPRLDSTA